MIGLCGVSEITEEEFLRRLKAAQWVALDSGAERIMENTASRRIIAENLVRWRTRCKAWFYAGRTASRDCDHWYFGGACCCRRFRRRARRPGAPTAKIGSSKLAWRFRTTPARSACFRPAEPSFTRKLRITWPAARPFGPDKQGLGWAYQILPYLEEGALQGLITQDQLQAATIPLYVCPSRRTCVGGPDQPRMPTANRCF